jgi:hypothetical protein
MKLVVRLQLLDRNSPKDDNRLACAKFRMKRELPALEPSATRMTRVMSANENEQAVCLLSIQFSMHEFAGLCCHLVSQILS